MFKDPRRGTIASVAQLSAWWLQLLACWALFAALGLDHQVAIGAAAACLFAVNVTAVVPATPSNIGIFQLAIISVLTKGFGVSAADALAYGVILQAIEIATAVALGVPALVREGVTWSDMRLRALSAAPVRLSERPPRASAAPSGSRPSPRARPAGQGALTASIASDPWPFRTSPASRIGRDRELKFATEGYWRGTTSAEELAQTAKSIRVENWRLMQEAGIDLIPSNDFSYYDQVLDTIALVGAVPDRYGWSGGQVDLDTYFAMARGRQTDEVDVTAMEMTKWFDTNYHYIVPELGPSTRFSLSSTKPFDEHAEAMEEVGIDTVPVLIGPVSFLLLSKPADGVPDDFDALALVAPLVEVYGEVIEKLAEQGATWVQLDEPCFVEDRSERELDALRLAYEELCKVRERPRIVVKTYFDHVGDAYGVLRDLPIEGVGLDLIGHTHGDGGAAHEHGGRHNVEFVANQEGLDDQWLFAGIVGGRNVWINDLEHSLDLLEGLRGRTQQLVVSTSCRPARPDRP